MTEVKTSDRKAVPREPTPIMMQACVEQCLRPEDGNRVVANIWRAMYDAAPIAERASVAPDAEIEQFVELFTDRSDYLKSDLRARDAPRWADSTAHLFDNAIRLLHALRSERDSLRAQVTERTAERDSWAKLADAQVVNVDTAESALRVCEAERDAAMKEVIEWKRNALQAESEIEAAFGFARDYAHHNPIHHFGDGPQDPNGVHAWLRVNDPAGTIASQREPAP